MFSLTKENNSFLPTPKKRITPENTREGCYRKTNLYPEERTEAK